MRRGFTLIELLVVIAIICILAAILFPVYAKAREMAKWNQFVGEVKQGKVIPTPDEQARMSDETIRSSLTFDHFGSGMSSIQAVFTNEAGQRRTMFLSDFEEVVPLMREGVLTGSFRFRRMGNRTGCQLVIKKAKK